MEQLNLARRPEPQLVIALGPPLFGTGSAGVAQSVSLLVEIARPYVFEDRAFPGIQSLDRLSESTWPIVGSVRTARRDCRRSFGGLSRFRD